MRDLTERFWSKVQQGEDDECWEWQAHIKPSGYGQFRTRKGPDTAHRVSWELTYGPIPTGLFVCHHCDNPSCCNPRHLFTGTCADNAADMVAKGRSRYPRLRNWKPTAAMTAAAVAKIRKLSDDQIREARVRRDAGETFRSIAKDMQVDHSNIVRACNGKSWKNVT